MVFMDLDMNQTANSMSTKFNGTVTIMASPDKNRAVKDTKQPSPTNYTTGKTDPSQSAFDDEEE
jgi:hypothetical protein